MMNIVLSEVKTVKKDIDNIKKKILIYEKIF